MTRLHKAFQNFLRKAIGFPVWSGSTTDILPGGWGSLEYGGDGTNQALRLATVYACCRVLCGTIGSLPWNIYREDPKSGTRTKATDHALYPILHDTANAYQTSMELRETLVLGFCLRGNGYAEKMMLGNRVVALNPLRADCMVPKMKSGGQLVDSPGLVYEYHGPQGTIKTYAPDQLIHIKNFSHDGIVGLSPLTAHAIRHAQYTEAYSTNFMRNQGRPSGVLQSKKPKPKDHDYNERLSNDWRRLYGGENAGGTAVLWDEMEYKQISISPEDAQYIETKKLSEAAICALYGVPGNMVGHTDKTATYASAEQFDLQFSKHTIRPLAVRIEQAVNKALFAKEPGTYCEFDLDALMRGDSKAQAEYFGSMVEHGNMNRNEVRRKVNLPEVDYGNKLTVQANMVDLDKLPDLSASATPGLVQGDIRKQADPPEPSFQLRVEKMEQTVLPQVPMKKRGRAWREPNGTIRFEVEEQNHGA